MASSCRSATNVLGIVLCLVMPVLAFAANASADAETVEQSANTVAWQPKANAVAYAWSTKFVPLYVQTQLDDAPIWIALDANYVLPATFVNRDPVTGWSTCSTSPSAPKFLKARKADFPAGDGYYPEMRASLNAAAMSGSNIRVLLQDVCDGGYVTFVGFIVDRPQ